MKKKTGLSVFCESLWCMHRIGLLLHYSSDTLMHMDRLTLKQRNALKATLMRVADLHPEGVLMCGFDAINERAFCKLIKLGSNLARLLTCTRIDIRGIGYYPQVERKFVEWLKSHIRTPSVPEFCNNLLTPANWLKYNIAPDLKCLHLGIAKIDYYLILKDEHLRYYRDKAYNNKKYAELFI